jgi:hypothetical protein
MSALAQAMLWVFVASLIAGLSGWLYAVRYFLPMWANGFRKQPRHDGYPKRVLIGACIFFGTLVVGFASGGIAELAGGWG